MKRLALIAVLAASSVFALASAAAADVGVRERVSVDAERVFLRDVATGPLPAVIGETFLVKTPPLGEERTINGTFVAARFRQAGADFPVRVPETVTIARPAQTVSAERLRAAVEEFVKTARPDAEAEFPVSIKDVMAPLGEATVSVEWPEDRAVEGRRPVPVVVRVGEFEKRVFVDTAIAAPEAVVVAKNAIPRGRAVTSDDVRVDSMPARKVRGRVARSPDVVVGRVARRAIATGEAFHKTALEAAPLVKKGDVVRLEVEAGGVSISVFAAAQRDGAEDEMIDVKNLDTGVIVKARVIDAHTVAVRL